jgi:hypothetical protein
MGIDIEMGTRFAAGLLARATAVFILLFLVLAPSLRADTGQLVYSFTLAPSLNYTSSFVTVAYDGSDPSAPAIVATGKAPEWNGYYTSEIGLLKGDHEYTAVLDYKIVTPVAPGSSFYLFARSESLGYSYDTWTTWTGAAGDSGSAVLGMALRGADDWRITAGMHGHGAIRVTGLRVYDGDGIVDRPAGPASTPQQPRHPPFAVPTGSGPIVVEPPRPAGAHTLNALDFGLRADSGPSGGPDAIATSNAAALQSAFDAVRTQGASTLVIPRGVYRIASSTAIEMRDLTDVTVDARGAELVVEQIHNGPVLEARNCRRFVLKNLILDWDWNVRPIATIAHIDFADKSATAFTISFPGIDSMALDAVRNAPWLSILPIETLRPTGAPAGRGIDSPPALAFTAVGPNTLQVSSPSPLPLKTGADYWIRHCDYEMPAVAITDGSDIALNAVVVYSMPGMGFVMGGSLNHWSLTDCHIVIPPGSNRPMTTARDGVHITNSHGYFLMKDCSIGHCGDDCVNVHDCCAQGVAIVDSHTVRIQGPQWWLNPAPGDILEFYRGDYTPTGFRSRVVSCRSESGALTVGLADAVPADLPVDAIVWNDSHNTSNVHITHCRFYDNTVRGLLLAARDATVDYCVFDHTGSRAFQVHTEIFPPHWCEGRGASDIVFAHNRIVNCNQLGVNDGSAIRAIPMLPGGTTSATLFHDILIEDNDIVNSNGPAIDLQSCARVLIEGNRIADRDEARPASPLASVIRVARSSNIDIEDNTWSGAHCAKTGVAYDPGTTRSISTAGNGVIPATQP